MNGRMDGDCMLEPLVDRRVCGEATNLYRRWAPGRLECTPLSPHPPCCLFSPIVARIHQLAAHPPHTAAPSHGLSSHAVNVVNQPYCSRLLQDLPRPPRWQRMGTMTRINTLMEMSWHLMFGRLSRFDGFKCCSPYYNMALLKFAGS